MDDRAELERLRALDSADADRQELERLRAADQQQPEQGYSARDLAAPWEGLAHVGTGALGSVAGGLAGLASLPFKDVNPAYVVRAVQEKMTYQPRGKLAQQLTDVGEQVMSIPAQISGAAGEKTLEATGSPVAATAVDVGLQTIPAVLGSKGVAALQESAAANAAKNAVKNATMRSSVEAGLKIPPSEMAQSEAGKAALRTVESFGGKAAMGQTASVLNNRTVTNSIRKQIGIPGEGQISEADLDAAKAPHFAVYDEAANVSPTAKSALEEWRKANFEEKRQRNFYRKSGDPKAEDAADAASSDAKLWMAEIESEALKSGRTDLVPKLRNARVELGKIGTVERALNEATGEVPARAMQTAKARGAPLSGAMKTAADFSEAFRGKLTQPDIVQPGVSKLDALLAAGGALLKGPKVLALTGVPYAVRRALLSEPVQKAMMPPKNITPMTNAEQLNRAALIAALQKQQEQ